MKEEDLPQEIQDLIKIRKSENPSKGAVFGFSWMKSTEGYALWNNVYKGNFNSFWVKYPKGIAIPKVEEKNDDLPSYYDNEDGSILDFCDRKGANPYETDAIRRLIRCRHKGEWESDIDKAINTLKLYKKERGHLYKNQTEKLNTK
jgi:hypothetical protein